MSAVRAINQAEISFIQAQLYTIKHLAHTLQWRKITIRELKETFSRFFATFLIKNQKRFSHQLSFKNTGLVLLFKAIFRHWNCFLLSVETDDKDGNR